jgi:hypothetical protein
MEGSVRSRENSLGYSRVTINPATESLRIDVIQVADVSPDLRNVTEIYPMDTVIDRIEIKKPGQKTHHQLISSKPIPLLSGVFSCKNNIVHSVSDLSSAQIPSCILHGLQV